MNQPKTQKRDIAIVGGPTDDGLGKHVVRVRDGQISAGEIRPAKEGQPIAHELVRLHPLGTDERVCAVEVLHAPGAPADPQGSPTQPDATPDLSRPARVATDRYRKNWDAIFDAKRKSTLN